MLGTISHFFKTLVRADTFKPSQHQFKVSDYRVSVDESAVSCISPDGEERKVFWNSLKTVIIRTNSKNSGVFWVLKGKSKSSNCVIPMGAKGEVHLLDRLQTLPEFDDGAFIEAMGSISNRKFVCWQSKPGQA